ncbi:MAG: Prolyl oligopeptidase [Candidatus Woesebacteria bacterium GW2011_GWA1_39_21b]|uniref:prolyl oligopeptidase n=2 Tax=Patescibacteria group TaxID=1783273 RepID=A0A1G2QFQ8_9BACT|nr:MAG: Prolyl oligopeptidase [Candidatus Woesebacteria bacterium GW2011_GWA1_39_21b]KKS77183.1 MAG: Prolyl oligopeptidase [Parcubacteria group bacterium GW2011_GWB1_42_9]KKS89757.1 MAG: Prolyl oligopeptidase [Parcubacteria group bacterium GW2011_GWC1_43_11b]OHA59327.1 MAG: hypothetical protein A2370_00050 [Candidatus Vogelbacteria bacterium RIFOXYB1_FULL_42_16]
MNTPYTKREDVTEKIWDLEISDPYRWLEDSNNQETKRWIDLQNKYTDSYLRDSYFEKLSKKLTKNFDSVIFSTPHFTNGYYFYTERQKKENQPVLYVRQGLDGTPIKLIDPNNLNSDNNVSLDYWTVSKSGKYLAYGLSTNGTEMATLFIKDVGKNENLKEEIDNCRYSSISWLSDDSGFFYTRGLVNGTVPKNEEGLHQKIYFHKLGDDIKNDELIFGQNRPKEDMIGMTISLDDQYLAIKVGQNWVENDIYLYNIKTKETKPLIIGISASFYPLFLKNKIIFYTNHRADNYRIISISLSELDNPGPIEKWLDLVREKEYPLTSCRFSSNKILLEYLKNVCSEVIICDHDGREIDKIPLPTYSSVNSISTNRYEEEFFYSVTSFTFPSVIYRYDPIEDNYKKFREIENSINPDDYNIEQKWSKSKDGSMIPFFVIYKKDLKKDGKTPTILYGYGGFKNSVEPDFLKIWIPWLEKGGIYASANIRGGGEFGKKWHEDGIRDKKQNSFDDFISVAEYLVHEGYTNESNIGILGGSNGGLLVSAVAVQKPDLFKAVCSKVPLTDMVRFHNFGIAIRWVNEYGDPRNHEELKDILKWSPYHNIKKELTYPSFFFTTAENDKRVDPLHARKMAAYLQSINTKTLIFTDIKSGHGSGKPVQKMIETQALILSFFFKELNLKIS